MESGDLLGDRYRLATPLGWGGTSVVWRARDEILGREVAVKLLAARLADDPALVTRLRIEAQAAAQLHHPHVVTVYDFGEAPQPDGRGVPYVVMELVQGRPLSELLRSGPLVWPQAVRIGAQVAAALTAAHDRGVVHRDVKPDNVMLTGAGAKLVDFGISATIGESDLGPDGRLLCTPAYLAPERLQTGPVRAAFDVYGLGLLLYKSLAGELPWECDGTIDLLTAHRCAPPAPLPPLPGLPAEVVDLCDRCLAKRPADRPSSAEAVRILTSASASVVAATPTRRLRSTMAGRAATPTLGSQSADDRPPTRSRRVLAVAAVGALLVGFLGARLAVDEPAVRSGGAAGEQAACQVRYDVPADTGRRFAAEVTLTNTAVDPVTGWRLDFTFPADQQLRSSTTGRWHQSGRRVTVQGSEAGATLAAGERMRFGVDGSYGDKNPLPHDFRLNGTHCEHLLTAAAGVADSDDPRERGNSGNGNETGARDDNNRTETGRSNGNGNGNGNGKENKGTGRGNGADR